jgi:hypothetical protein
VEAAEEIGRIAVLWLEEFDTVFASRINNASRCQIGGMNMSVDFNSLLIDLQQFYVAFSEPILDCEINQYLTKSKRAKTVLNDDQCKDLTAVSSLNDLLSKNKTIHCKSCSKIGDMVISLEVPASMGVAHVDASFDSLCAAQGLTSFKISSERSLYSESKLAALGPDAKTEDL